MKHLFQERERKRRKTFEVYDVELLREVRKEWFEFCLRRGKPQTEATYIGDYIFKNMIDNRTFTYIYHIDIDIDVVVFFVFMIISMFFITYLKIHQKDPKRCIDGSRRIWESTAWMMVFCGRRITSWWLSVVVACLIRMMYSSKSLETYRIYWSTLTRVVSIDKQHS